MLPVQSEHFVLTPRDAEQELYGFSDASSLGWPEDGHQDDPWLRDARWVDLTDALPSALGEGEAAAGEANEESDIDVLVRRAFDDLDALADNHCRDFSRTGPCEQREEFTEDVTTPPSGDSPKVGVLPCQEPLRAAMHRLPGALTDDCDIEAQVTDVFFNPFAVYESNAHVAAHAAHSGADSAD